MPEGDEEAYEEKEEEKEEEPEEIHGKQTFKRSRTLEKYEIEMETIEQTAED